MSSLYLLSVPLFIVRPIVVVYSPASCSSLIHCPPHCGCLLPCQLFAPYSLSVPLWLSAPLPVVRPLFIVRPLLIVRPNVVDCSAAKCHSLIHCPSIMVDYSPGNFRSHFIHCPSHCGCLLHYQLSVPLYSLSVPLWLSTPLPIVRPTLFTVRPIVVDCSAVKCPSLIHCPSIVVDYSPGNCPSHFIHCPSHCGCLLPYHLSVRYSLSVH